ncbi:MAG: nucleotide sugar dehydrogenase [Candidatus Micrarchaeia archaeon]
MLIEKIKKRNAKIGVLGLGYVGLPLVVKFAEAGFRIIAYDINQQRVEQLKNGEDRTKEETKEKLLNPSITYSSSREDLRGADIYIIAVPTPVDGHKVPDLGPVIGSSETVGKIIGKGALVILESTVYPGVSEEIMAKRISEVSGLEFPRDFKIGYSPERINPGDSEHTLVNTTKIVSGCDREISEAVDVLYRSIVERTYIAKSIKVAEAAKIIENVQRDLNIALVNELAVIFDKMGIDTYQVLEAAGTKWNFLKFKPGLVGGHCIPVDPYYLVYKAEGLGHHPQVISAGRRVNDGMAKYAAEKIVKKLCSTGKAVSGARGIMLGVTFKENIVDIRNSQAAELANELKSYGVHLSCYDPLVEKKRISERFNVDKVLERPEGEYDFAIVTVMHDSFKELDISKLLKKGGILLDVQNSCPRTGLPERGITTLTL